MASALGTGTVQWDTGGPTVEGIGVMEGMYDAIQSFQSKISNIGEMTDDDFSD